MTTVIVSEDCGNSPKNIFLQNLTIAFAKRDVQFILDSVTDDIRWHIVGENSCDGKADFAKLLDELENDRVDEITIQHVVTHGKAGAVNGVRKLSDGKTVAFCDVVEFSGAKGAHVREITSYVIQVNSRRQIEHKSTATP